MLPFSHAHVETDLPLPLKNSTQKTLVDHMENTFVALCILLAGYMTAKEILRYFRNDDMSTISYRNFASSSKDKYPTFSICFMGNIHSYFNDEIPLATRLANFDFRDFNRLLRGDLGPYYKFGLEAEKRFDIRNVSEDLVGMFTRIQAYRHLFSEFYFSADNKTNTILIDTLVDYNKSLPLYISHQDSETICFTRKDDAEKHIIRSFDALYLPRNQIDKFSNSSVRFQILIHHPGQLLRKFDAPVVGSFLKSLDWKKSFMALRISQVSVLRKRSDSNTPCNPEVYDDDLRVRIRISEKVGCIPPYWKTIMNDDLKLESCKTPDDLKRIYKMTQNLGDIFSEYDPPCNVMKLNVAYNMRPWYTDSLRIAFMYEEKDYQEIINEREFGLESLWSTVGGFVGIFVGTSLSQVPTLLAKSWTSLQKAFELRYQINLLPK